MFARYGGRLDDPDFAQRLDQARRQSVQVAIDAIGGASAVAAVTLRHLMRPKFAPAIRLRAAMAVLELGHKYRETAALEERITALEEALRERTP